MTLTTSRERAGDTCRVLLAGELDLATAQLVIDEVSAALEEGASTVILDLRELSFLDSSGMRAFFELRDLATQRGATLSAQGARGMVRRAIDVTGVAFADA